MKSGRMDGPVSNRHVLSLSRTVLDLVYPVLCPGCGNMVRTWARSPICPECWSLIRVLPSWVCHCCGVPMPALKDDPHHLAEEMADLFLCSSCRDIRPWYCLARSAAIYNRTSPVRAAILALKHGRNISCLKPLLALLLEQFPRQMPRIENELVIPVPLHWGRFLGRGFNQSAYLAGMFARSLGLEFRTDVLIRHRNTPPQSGDASARMKNIAGAFKVRKIMRIRERPILLIDDVMTTGSTLNECALILREKGSGPVRVFTVARVTF